MPCTLIFGSASANRCQSIERDRVDNGLMHGLGETVPPYLYVWRLILIEVDRVSKDIVGGFPSHLGVHRQIRLYRSHKTRCRTRLKSGETPRPPASGLDIRWTQGSVRLGRRYSGNSATADISFIGTLSSQGGVQGPRPNSCNRGCTRGLGSEESHASTSTPVPERAPASATAQNTDLKAKPRDLYAPQEEQGVLPLTMCL